MARKLNGFASVRGNRVWSYGSIKLLRACNSFLANSLKNEVFAAAEHFSSFGLASFCPACAVYHISPPALPALLPLLFSCLWRLFCSNAYEPCFDAETEELLFWKGFGEAVGEHILR
jgi:hypothetical protein